jgi:hypothetical protein
MLPVAIVKVVQIAAGLVVGNLASDALDKAVVGVKKVVEAKKKETQK